MLRIRMSDGLFIFGLDAENVRRLVSGQPIHIELEQLGGTDKILIMAGETLADVAKEIEEATGIALPKFDMPEEMQCKSKN
jgi:hypothetical protein